MSSLPRIEIHQSIDAVLQSFAAERASRLPPSEDRLCRHVLFLLELCINNYGHRNLDAEERASFEEVYHRDGRDFFELFGPEKLLPELDFFCRHYLRSDVVTSERVIKRAPSVIEELRAWLVERGLVSAELATRERARAAARRRLRHRLGHLVAALAPTVVSVAADGLAGRDYVAFDHHPVARVASRRLWLSIFPEGKIRLIGPVVVPAAVSSGVHPSWIITGALGRLGGRWRFVDLVGIYPRV